MENQATLIYISQDNGLAAVVTNFDAQLFQALKARGFSTDCSEDGDEAYKVTWNHGAILADYQALKSLGIHTNNTVQDVENLLLDSYIQAVQALKKSELF